MARTKGALGKKTIAAQSQNPNMARDLNPSFKCTAPVIDGFLYVAASCGCSVVKPMIGCGLMCEHKNSMVRKTS
jgi:hypothetical protein